MNLNHKKILKIVTLLIATIVIGTVSADAYYSLSMTSTISFASNDVVFATGADSVAAGFSTSDPYMTATMTGLKARPDVETVYAEAGKVVNNAESGSSNVRLRSVSVTGNAADFEYINFVLMDGATEKARLDYTVSGSAWVIPSTTNWTAILGQAQWSLRVETKAADDATTGSVDIVIAIDVQ
jgi:hypothetical protein